MHHPPPISRIAIPEFITGMSKKLMNGCTVYMDLLGVSRRLRQDWSFDSHLVSTIPGILNAWIKSIDSAGVRVFWFSDTIIIALPDSTIKLIPYDLENLWALFVSLAVNGYWARGFVFKEGITWRDYERDLDPRVMAAPAIGSVLEILHFLDSRVHLRLADSLLMKQLVNQMIVWAIKSL